MTNDIMNQLPSYYQDSKTVLNMQGANQNEIDRMRASISDVLDQFFLDTATWGLAKYEARYGIKTDESKSYETRRALIKAKKIGVGNVTIPFVKEVAESFNNGSVDVKQYTKNLIPPNTDPAWTLYSKASFLATFAGKVGGSVVENPHAAFAGSFTSLPASAVTTENFGSIYSRITAVDGTVQTNATSTNAYISYHRFSFNIIEAVTRKYGSSVFGSATTIADKVAWLRANLTQVNCNWHGYGSGAAGAKATLATWIGGSTQTWGNNITNHTNSTVTKLTSQVTQGGSYPIASRLDENGYLYFIAYANSSDGAIASSISTDYIELEIEVSIPFLQPNWIANFEGKVAASTVENPHIIKRTGAATIQSPLISLTETDQTRYDQSRYLDGTIFNHSTNTNGNTIQVFFSFNLIEHIIRKYGSSVFGSAITIADRAAWIKVNISKLVLNWWGYGNSATGNKAYLSRWRVSTAAYATAVTNTSTAPTLLRLGYGAGETTSISTFLSESLDPNGFVHFIAYPDASNGTIASTIYTDYVELEVTPVSAFVQPTWVASFEGKVSGSVVENPHSAKRVGTTTSLQSPSSGTWSENSDTRYAYISKMDPTDVNWQDATASGAIAQQLFSFNLIEFILRKYGSSAFGSAVTTVDRVAWLRTNITGISCNWWGYGNGPSGNGANLKYWNAAGSTYNTTPQTHTNGTVSKLTNASITSGTSVVDDNGFFHVIVYAEAANGTINSNIYTDYVELVVTCPATNVGNVAKNNITNNVGVTKNLVVNNDYSITLNATSANQFSSIKIPVFPSRTYAFSCKAIGDTNIRINVNRVVNNGTTANTYGGGNKNTSPVAFTFTTDADEDFVYINLYSVNSGTYTFYDLQLELSNAVTPFEPRKTYTVGIQFTSLFGVPSNLTDMQAALTEIIPAHLQVVFEFLYKTWNDFDAKGFTFDQLDAKNLTFDMLDAGQY